MLATTPYRIDIMVHRNTNNLRSSGPVQGSSLPSDRERLSRSTLTSISSHLRAAAQVLTPWCATHVPIAAHVAPSTLTGISGRDETTQTVHGGESGATASVTVTVDDETTATTIEELRGAIGGPLRIPMGAGQATAAINGGETQTASARGTTAVGIVTAANGVQIATVNENANVNDIYFVLVSFFVFLLI